MLINYIWLLVVFVGFVMQVFLTGVAFKDRQWFQRLGFSEDAQDIAQGDVETEIKDCMVHFIFLLVGVVSFLRTYRNPQPLTVYSLIIGLVFTAAPIVLIVFSFRRQRRRAKVEKRSRDDAMEVLARKVEHVEERR